MQNKDKEFLLKAIEKAKESVAQGGFPAGAVLVLNGEIISSGICLGGALNDPTSHGELVSIREACKKLQTTNISGAVLYSSMQPCLMCFGAAMWSGVSKIVFACSKDKVLAEYYGGHYHVVEINKELLRPIEILQIPELEDVSLEIVRNWEKSL